MIRPKIKQHTPSTQRGNTRRLTLPLAAKRQGRMSAMLRAIFISHYRKRVREAIITDTTDELYNIVSPSGTTPEGTYLATKIIYILRRISNTYRRPFSLYVKGHKYAEISKELHLPVGTVKRRIYYIIRQICSRRHSPKQSQ